MHTICSSCANCCKDKTLNTGIRSAVGLFLTKCICKIAYVSKSLINSFSSLAVKA